MKKLKYLLFLLLIVPFNVKAIYFNGNDEVKENKQIEESSVIAGNKVELDNKVSGLNVVLGNDLKISGESEYLLSLGNNINISGNIKNDGFILGNNINIKDFKLNRDLVIMGNNIEISGEITKNLIIFANKITLKGNYNNVSIKSNEIIIDGKINKLEYNEDANLNNLENSSIGETIKTEKIHKNLDFNTKAMNFIYSFGGSLFMFLALYLIAPILFNRIEEKNKNITVLNMFSFFGFGTLSVILIPVIFILLVSLVFGIPFAFLLLIVYFISLWLSSLFTGYLFGDIIWNKFIKKNKNPLLVGLLGISLIKLLCIIPGIGYLIQSISIMIGMGIVLQQFKRD